MAVTAVTSEIRLRSRVREEAIRDQIAGRVLGPADYDLLLTGPARVVKPDGQPLAVYLPGVMKRYADDDEVFQILHDIKQQAPRSANRGHASGTQRIKSPQARSYAKVVASAIVGAVDPLGQQRYCRLTSWTGTHLPQWQRLQPMLRAVAARFAECVPQRYAAQMERVRASDPSWIVPGTPFTTITVNNTYPTGVHKDQGDLEAGFSTITCLRRGPYTGGQLIFPAWRTAVDLQDGDLILMDAHDWHGNVPIICHCGNAANGPCKTCGAERISVVAYYRTKIANCGSPDEEIAKATARREATNA